MISIPTISDLENSPVQCIDFTLRTAFIDLIQLLNCHDDLRQFEERSENVIIAVDYVSEIEPSTQIDEYGFSETTIKIRPHFKLGVQFVYSFISDLVYATNFTLAGDAHLEMRAHLEVVFLKLFELVKKEKELNKEKTEQFINPNFFNPAIPNRFKYVTSGDKYLKSSSSSEFAQKVINDKKCHSFYQPALRH